jgi:nucleoside-diphosphate-sugar epimerase
VFDNFRTGPRSKLEVIQPAPEIIEANRAMRQRLAAELYCQGGLEAVRLRFFNMFDPRQRSHIPYSGVIAFFIAGMVEGRLCADTATEP